MKTSIKQNARSIFNTKKIRQKQLWVEKQFRFVDKKLIPKQTRLLFQLFSSPQFRQPILWISLKMMSNGFCCDKFTTLKYPYKLLMYNFSFLKELCNSTLINIECFKYFFCYSIWLSFSFHGGCKIVFLTKHFHDCQELNETKKIQKHTVTHFSISFLPCRQKKLICTTKKIGNEFVSLHPFILTNIYTFLLKY